MKQATFIQRLLAFILDFVIVVLISSIIGSFFANKKIENLQNELKETMTNYMNETITMEEYKSNTEELTYKIEKESIKVNYVSLIVVILYYVVFQYANKGKTIGKKILKIKTIDNKNNNPKIYQLFIKSLFTNQIVMYLTTTIIISIFKKELFIKTYYCMTLITYIFMIITSMMVLYRKDKLGLNDIMSRTKVVKEGIENE